MTSRFPWLPAVLALALATLAGCQTAPAAPPQTGPAGSPAAGVATPAAATSPGAPKAASPAASPAVSPAASPARAAPPAAAASPAMAASPVAAAPKPSGPPTPLTVILDWYPWANHTGLYLARDNGYFAAEGLDVKIEQPANPEDVLRIVSRGQNLVVFNYHKDDLNTRCYEIPVQ